MANPAPKSPPVGPVNRVSWQRDGWIIELALDNDIITTATLQWNDPSADGVFLTKLGQSLKGMGLRQARDHGVQYAIGGTSAIAGIIMPANYSPTSRAAVKALRTAIDAAIRPNPKDWNFEDHGLSEAWRAISKDERSRRLDGLIGDYLRKHGLADAVTVTDIDQYDRVFLQFHEDFPVAEKPPILMRLERHVREATGERIELFMSEMKDNNKLRRL
jgi:hypothetical protein